MLAAVENNLNHTTARRFGSTGKTHLIDATNDDRAALQAWLRAELDRKGVSPTRAAKDNELATTTITKFLNDPAYKFTLSTPNIRKLERYFGSAAPTSVVYVEPAPSEMAEGKRIDIEALPASLKNAIIALREGRKTVEEWQILGPSMMDAGYYPGDIVLVDKAEYARAGEPVLAMSMAEEGHRPVFRLYEKPYLVAATSQPGYRTPLLVDDKNVIVVGPILGKLGLRKPQ